MVNRNKTKSLCPGQAGCGGRGVLNAPRKFGGNSKSETQKTFEKMKQIRPDLSRATANAMLGVGQHPYRRIANDTLVPKKNLRIITRLPHSFRTIPS